MRCGVDKTFSEFYQATKRLSGYFSYCKDCCSIIHSIWKDSDVGRRRLLIKKMQRVIEVYKVSPRDAVSLVLDKNRSCCEICGAAGLGTKLHIDHNHSTNTIRGYLCYKCNLLVGYASESVDILTKAIAYLNKHTTS